MKNDRRIILTIFWIILGAVLLILGVMEKLDSYWSGMGGGLLGVGILQMVRFVRYHRDEQYREKVDIQNSDERNRFLAGRAWAWAGYLYVLINGVAVIALRLLGKNEMSMWAAWSVCLLIMLYWLSWLWMKKKY